MANSTALPFPYDSWTAVNQRSWSPLIVSWFKECYPISPYESMSLLLEHVFVIINNTWPVDTPRDKIMRLGDELLSTFDGVETYNLSQGRDKRIITLLKVGIHQNHSHLFMLPKVLMANLLDIDEYSALLLSTKLYAAGNFTTAQMLVTSIATGCPLAQYVIGQCARKQGGYRLAQSHFDDAMKELDNWKDHRCPFNQGFQSICNEHLLRAEAYRGRAVVFRKEKLDIEAERAYQLAQSSVEEMLNEGVASEQISDSNLSVRADYDRFTPYRVKADVYFSHGYYLYDKNKYTEAKELFVKAINALETANEKWDSPYTRLAIVQFCEGNLKDSAETFTRALMLCQETDIDRNREAPLSKSLCSLGLKLIEVTDQKFGKLSFTDYKSDIQAALKIEPRLSLAPLECHRDDAGHFVNSNMLNGIGAKLVASYLKILEKEIAVHKPNDKNTFELLRKLETKEKTFNKSEMNSFVQVGGNLMGDINIVTGQAGAVGSNSSAENNAFQQMGGLVTQGVDMELLANQLIELRQAMKKRVTDVAEHDEAIGAIASAEQAAKSGDKTKLVEMLFASTKNDK